MLLRAFNEGNYLEQVTGLDQLHKDSEAVLDDMEWDEDEDDE